MTDVFDTKKRSEVMSRIRSKGTRAEETLSSLIRDSLGRRWRIDRNVAALPGCPDVVVPSLRLAIFAHGCFYHCCSKHGHTPKSNRLYWVPKLARNRRRDRLNESRLRSLGFSVWTVWEHSLEGSCLQKTKLTIRRRIERSILARTVARGRPTR